MPSAPHAAPPADLLASLRAAREQEPEAHARQLAGLGMRPLDGGRNNLVYARATEPPTVVKLYYKRDDKRRLEREWTALNQLAEHHVDDVPAPLWKDEHPETPAVGMSTVPGTPIPDLPDPAVALPGLIETWQRIHVVPLRGVLAELARIDNAAHFAARLTDVWPGQFAAALDDPLTGELTQLLNAWQQAGDAGTLAEPQPAAFSRGDANLLNWLHDPATGRTGVVDFEFAGYSDPAYDAAELVEHISARIFDDEVWAGLLPALGVDSPMARRRFNAAARTCALRWLAVLWKQRARRVTEFTAQLERVHRLQRSDTPLLDTDR